MKKECLDGKMRKSNEYETIIIGKYITLRSESLKLSKNKCELLELFSDLSREDPTLNLFRPINLTD